MDMDLYLDMYIGPYQIAGWKREKKWALNDLMAPFSHILGQLSSCESQLKAELVGGGRMGDEAGW